MRREGQELDLAWLEVSGRSVVQADMSTFALADVQPLTTEDHEFACLVQGYPEATVHPPEHENERSPVESDELTTLFIPPPSARGSSPAQRRHSR